jgi:hypothetical protein
MTLASRWPDLVAHDDGVIGMSPWRDARFRTIAEFLVIGLGWSAFGGILGPAIWHGTSRRHAFRRAQLYFSVAFAWCVALIVPAIVLPVWLRLSWLGLFGCLLAGATGVILLIGFGLRHVARRWPPTCRRPPARCISSGMTCGIWRPGDESRQPVEHGAVQRPVDRLPHRAAAPRASVNARRVSRESARW